MLSVFVFAAALGVPAPALAGDLALDRPATASSTEDGRSDLRPALANDGTSTTRWSSAYTDYQWWEVDLGSVSTIDRVELNWEVAYASRYRIRTRASTSDPWSTAVRATIGAPGLQVHTFTPRSARYVRITGDGRGTPWGISLWDARVCDDGTCAGTSPDPEPSPEPTPSPTPTPTPSPTPSPEPPPGPGGQVTLQQVDGGPSYYGQFSNPLPTSSSYFPIGVWGAYNQTQANRDLDAAAGINTYVWAADNSYVDDIRADGRFRIIQDEGNRANVGSETSGWLLGDEIDMCCGPPGFAGGNGFQMLTNANLGLPADGRLRYTNYGKGVMFWETDAQAAQFVNLPFLGLVSNDVYWFTDPNERNTAGYRVAASYGDTVTRMRYLDGLDGRRKPIWNFVETGWPFTESAAQGGRSIQPAELRAAVWHSLIAGARGIIYFEHSFGGPHIGDHHTLRTNSEGTRPMVTSVDAQVQSLAPVLNSPTVTSGFTKSANVRAMAKWDGRNFYVFAGADRVASTPTFSLPCVGNATATVVGESRSVPVNGGSFSDAFADANAVHIYRIDGGSRCGM